MFQPLVRLFVGWLVLSRIKQKLLNGFPLNIVEGWNMNLLKFDPPGTFYHFLKHCETGDIFFAIFTDIPGTD